MSGAPQGYAGAPLIGVLIGELLRRGHRVSAFTTDSSLPPEAGVRRIGGSAFDLYLCPACPRAWRVNGSYPGRAVDCFARERAVLTGVMVRAAPDLIHAHWTYEFALAALDTGLPCLVTCHDDPRVVLRHTRSPYRAIRYFMARRVFTRAHHFTTVSSYMADALARSAPGIPVVPNPVADYALSKGWELHGSPTMAWDPLRGVMRCGQAVTKEIATPYHPDMKLGEQ